MKKNRNKKRLPIILLIAAIVAFVCINNFDDDKDVNQNEAIEIVKPEEKHEVTKPVQGLVDVIEVDNASRIKREEKQNNSEEKKNVVDDKTAQNNVKKPEKGKEKKSEKNNAQTQPEMDESQFFDTWEKVDGIESMNVSGYTYHESWQYELNLYVGSGGTVKVEPEKEYYVDGDVVTLTATTKPGWEFAYWDISSNQKPQSTIQIKMEGNTIINAVFGKIITIADPALELGVRKQLNKPTGYIHTEDLERISYLNVEGKGIKSLEGLQHFTVLSFLVLNDNEITDISPLAYCENLQGIDLYNNKIVDISPLRNLTVVDTLQLGQNPIQDFSPVAGYYDKLSYKDFTID